MKLSNSFFYTIREDIKDEETISGKLLVKSGLIKKTSSGIYMFQPLGFKVLKKIEQIIRKEMNQSGAQELLMPCLLPEDIYESSGRRANFGHEMFSLKDRNNRNMVLGPTHEELFVEAAKMKIKSYKDMPFNLYQIGEKYRDEPRPRYGLIRVREFSMKDAYSFDIDDENCEKSYQIMKEAYKRIYDQLNIDYRIVQADTGAMGGKLSEEFQAITEIGEDILVLCDKCGYSSNIEVSECLEIEESKEILLEKKLIHTPNSKTIEEIADLLKEDKNKFVKTLIYNIDGEFYACLLPGNRELCENKVKKLLRAKEIKLAEFDDVKRITNAEVGFAGPIDLSIPIVVDRDVLKMKNFIVGANKTDYHYQNVNSTDFEYTYVGDIKEVLENDPCPICNHPLSFKKGIEIGNIFKLGTKYSESLDLRYLDENNELKPVVMGCYGIGPGRIMASLVEQSHDEKGIIWPINVAPFQVGIVLIDSNDEIQEKIANELYEQMTKEGIEVLLDDRKLRPGVKFNDLDLIGIPIRIVIGKKVNEGLVEFKLRTETNSQDIKIENVIEKLKNTNLPNL